MNKQQQLITSSGIPDIESMVIPEYASSSYKLGEEVINNIKWWGQVNQIKNQYTALFICPECKDIFREQIIRVLNGAIINCNCK